jgi:succinyl-diaminopimelate desuccinylase
MKEEIVQIAKDLISIPSVTGDTKENQNVLTYIAKYLGDGIKPKVFTKNNITSMLWSNAQEEMSPKLLLCAHVDVVDVGDRPDLFQPKIEDNMIIGRGAGDMKGQTAAVLWCFKNALRNNIKNIGLLVTTDEEVGGFDGAKFVVESGLQPGIVFIPDGGDNFQIVLSEKAPHHVVIEAQGKGGHASRAFELDNPINKIFAFYEEARKEFSKATKEEPWATTFEMTTIESDSHSKNKIPSRATASFSWRWPLEQIEFNTGRATILEIAKKHNCTVIGEEGWGEGTVVKKDQDFIQEWCKSVEKNVGRTPEFTQSHGASDARHFYNSKEFGTKNILISAPKSGGHHADTEWIDINSLIMFAQTLETYITQVT